MEPLKKPIKESPEGILSNDQEALTTEAFGRDISQLGLRLFV